MAIVKNLINQAYAAIASIDDGEEADGVDSQLAITLLNQVLAQANADQIFPHLQAVVPFTVNGAQSYTIGAGTPAADIVAPRPEFINAITYKTSADATPTPVWRVDVPELYAIIRTNSGTPKNFCYNAGYPNGTITFDVPPLGGQIVIVYMQEIPAITDQNEVLSSIPPKYDDFIVNALARRLAVHKRRPPEIVTNLDSLYYSALHFIQSTNGRAQVPTLSDFASANRSPFANRASFWG
jgi:hypothetical protein